MTVLLAAAVLLLAVASAPADAGGSWFETDKSRYEPGDTVTLVGHTSGGQYGWIEDGPFFGYLLATLDTGDTDREALPLALGRLEVVETGEGGWRRLRASISFRLPLTLPDGQYFFDYCNAVCDERLGDLIGGAVYVGLEPDAPLPPRPAPPPAPMIEELPAPASRISTE